MRLDQMTGSDYRYCKANCPFSEEEEAILDARRRGKSVVSISMEMNLSEGTVKRRISSIKNKVARELF